MSQASFFTTSDLDFPTAGWGRRILGLLVDWFVAQATVVLLLGTDYFGSVWVLLAYVVETALLTALFGTSFGKTVTRLRTVRSTGGVRPVSPPLALLRQVLIVLVVPPLVFRPADGRGLHDLVAGTATVTLQTYRRLAGLDR